MIKNVRTIERQPTVERDGRERVCDVTGGAAEARSVKSAILSSPRKRGPIRRVLSMSQDLRKIESSVSMGPRLRGDDNLRCRSFSPESSLGHVAVPIAQQAFRHIGRRIV